jgi:TonB family protein
MLSGFAIVLTILLSPFGAFVVRGQGGTGREIPKTPAKSARPASKTTPPKRNAPVFRPKNPGIELVGLPPGSFMMGSTNGDADQKPVYLTTISRAFYLGKYEVTQAQWQAVMGNNPSSFKNCGGNCPAEQISWDDAQEFLQKLNHMNDGYTYRLPTEGEWEYACRAGTTGDYAGTLDAMAWYGNNSGRHNVDAAEIWRTDKNNYLKRIDDNGNKTHPVGTKQPNAFGLYDMHGNVWEWCQDWYHDNYNGAPADGGAWLGGGEQKGRVVRGGSWIGAGYLRSADRTRYASDKRLNVIGFRVVAIARTATNSSSTNPTSVNADPVLFPPDTRNPGETKPKSSTELVEEKVYAGKDVDQRARVLDKPKPFYTEAARKNVVSGQVVLRAVLASSGQVTNIRVISGLPHGLTEQAIAAARKLKFTPAMKDGRAVSQEIQLEYNFSPY